ncbi:MAG TPA: hypothetical protein VH061_11020 [Solirubrobacteraceae bacterium]|jgi:hypothetical protein|nr:hypothetical protein [Solirubrobacteraceae bacterium]
MLRGPFRFLLGGRLTGVVVVGMVAEVRLADVLGPVFVVFGAGRVPGAEAGVLATVGSVVLGGAAPMVLDVALVGGSGGLAEPHPAGARATTISKSHLRIRGRLSRKRGCELHQRG